MKRRVLSLVIALALCLNLCPTWGLAAAAQSDAVRDGSKFTEDVTVTSPHVVSGSVTIDTDVYTLTASGSTAIRVTGTGALDLRGRVIAKEGSGVEVQNGGSLRITESGTQINSVGGYGLDIASGATVYLSAGRYTGTDAAIRTADGDFADLLAEGCAYFADNGTPILDIETATVVNVGPCAHSKKSYTHTPGTTSHDWTCPFCGMTGADELCTVVFNQETGAGTCACGNSLQITVDERGLSDLVYDGTLKPGSAPPVTLTADSHTQLVENTDYSVNYVPRTDAGEITVTVTGITFNGTFTKTYTVKPDQPGIIWDTSVKPVPVEVDYDGSPVEAGDLPTVKINIQSTVDHLENYLQYSYKKQGDPDYTDGLPTNAGTYDVIASLPAMPNFEAAVSEAITLTIRKIAPIDTPPAATVPTFNYTAQELVTAGTLKDVAVRDGLQIQFATSEAGTYSTTIPTETNAGEYHVWYRVEGSDNNYIIVGPAEVSDVKILPKSITPTVEVLEPSYTYDGSKKSPQITVKDGNIVIDPVGQYTVTWTGTKGQAESDILRVVDTYTATITSTASGNYAFTATTKVEIVNAEQGALTITGQPEHVYYGDTITTLRTTGGTGDGEVKWSITAGGGSAEIVEATGVLTVKGTGSVTVKAERVVPNYGTVSDTWTFTVKPKPVLAEVTVAPKDYDGTTTIGNGEITAAVKSSDLVNGDTVTLSGLTGSYADPNAGTGKTVTLDDTNATKTDGSGKYAVSYPATVKGDINPRNVTVTVTLSGNDLKTDTSVTPNVYYYDYNGTDRTPTVTVTAIDDNALLVDSDYSVTYADNRNVGNATVTVTAKAGGNYTFTHAEVKFAIRNASAELTKTPEAKDLTYTGQPQDLVGVGTATGGTVVYSNTDKDDPDSYSTAIPQGMNAGTYIVYYMAKGDANHSDTTPGQVSVTIKPKSFTPTITLEQDSYEYDGNPQTPTVTVTDGAVTVNSSEYTVSYRDNINAGTATVTVSDNNGGNYIVSGTANFTITKKAPTVTPPTAISGLQYNGETQDLVTAGVTGDGTVKYSVNGGNYTTAVPSASAVGTYAIEWKVEGDANHKDTGPADLEVKIDKNTVTNPTITLSSDQFKYTGGQQKPIITVKDDKGRLIPEEEYTVTIEGTNGNVGMVNVDTYTVEITTPDSSNYVIADDGTVNNTRTFEIVPADQETISITGTKAEVYYGDKIQLGATGGTGAGTLTWKVTDENGNPAATSTISSTGLLTVQGVGGPYTVKVTRTMENYGDVSASWEFSAAKKPVTAEVTVAPKDYDGTTNIADTAITATVKAADLAFSGDSITITGLTGTYDNANVGTDKTVALTGGAVGGTDADKYDVTIPATTTASILAVPATVKENSVTAVPSLTYNASRSQALVTVEADAVTGGTMVYSLDGTNFTANIPQAKDAGTYTVRYKAQGDQNHTDSDVGTVDVTITQQSVAADKIQIELSPSSGRYDGTVQQPAVTVRDETNNVIPESEYKVTYVTDNSENWKDQGAYKVKVENITGGNYIIDTATADFEISTSAQAPLEIVNKPGLVYYGDTFTLSAVGGSASQTVTWSSSDASIADIDANGFVTIKGVGPATITAEKAGGGNYDTVQATYPFNARQKPITAIVKADDKEYDGNTNATIHVTWETGALEPGDSIGTSSVSGTFVDENAGTNKTVNITGALLSDDTSQKYDITLPSSVTASIFKAVATAPLLTANNRTYDGTAKDLVTGGDPNTRYSDSRDGVYSETVPTGTKAGTYTVWYKTAGDANHNESEPQSIQVTIGPKTLTADTNNTTLSGSDLKTDTDVTPNVYYYLYDGTDKTPTVTIMDDVAVVSSGEYTVSYSDHKNVGTATVTITDNEGGNYVVNGSVTFEIRQSGAQLTSSPQAVVGLTYTGQPLELVTVGTATGGHLEYRLHSETDPQPDYSTDIPTGINADTYTVDYKVVGDGNHGDGPSGSVMVTIKPKEVVSPKITVEGSYTFDGNPRIPDNSKIVVKDGEVVIPGPGEAKPEYSVSYQNNVNAGTATVIVSDNNGGNYTVNGTATFEIAKGTASVTAAPNGLKDLPYNGTDQALVTAGSATGGTMVYSLTPNGEYTTAIPTGKTVGTHTVWYKVQGDGNHNDSTAASVTASIVKNTVSHPTVQVEPESATYTGEKQEPTVTVKDDSGLLIDGSEYTVTYTHEDNCDADLIRVGKYTLTITGKDPNYSFTATAVYQIIPADQTPLTITGKRDRVYYGDTIQLGTEGGTEGGTVTWTVDNGSIANITGGLLKIIGVGSVTVTATSAKTGYADQTATWSFYANPKPVEAIVTAKSKNYDGNETAEVTATLVGSGLVNENDDITITLKGSFEDANVGTDKKVTIDRTKTQITGAAADKYDVTYPATVTASILKADVTNVTEPEAATGLEYTGLAQTLVKPEAAGSSPDGTMEYSLDGKTYSASLPTGTDAGDYDVWYRVKGDGNHNDTTGKKLDNQVTIAPQEVSADELIIEFEPTGASYDGQEHKPSVTVKDKNGRVIPESEYDVAYGNTSWILAGGHEVTVTGKTGGNYTIPEAKKLFTIRPAGQSTLSIVNQPGRVQYGDSFTLSTSGGSGSGTVTWQSDKPEIASIEQNGLVTVHKSGGPVKITATREVSGYNPITATWTFSVEKKPVTPIVTARNKEYDGNDTAGLVITWKDGDLVGNDSITFTPALTGKFEDANVGTNKTVNISGTKPTSDKYDVTIPSTTTASITPKVATVTGTPPTELTYDRTAQKLVTNVTATNGDLAYSRDGVSYTRLAPTETNAGTYTVWYKAQASGNYTDSPAVMVEVTIKPKEKTLNSGEIELSPEEFEYDGTAKKPDVVVKDGSVVIPEREYTVKYTNNTAVGTATVTIIDAEGGNYTVSGSETFTIKAGAVSLKDTPKPNNRTYDGFEQDLVTAGTAVNGRVVYSRTKDGSYSTSIPTETNAGSYQVWYKVEGDNGAGDTEPKSIIVTIQPKEVTPIIRLENRSSYSVAYSGNAQEPDVTVYVENKLYNGLYDVSYANNTNVGTAEVTVQSMDGNYQFLAFKTFEITKGKAEFLTPPTAKTLEYTGESQKLVTAGIAKQSGLLAVYSTDGNSYLPVIPSETNRGEYVVIAKVQGNEMYEDSELVVLYPEIVRNTVQNPIVTLSSSSMTYTGSELKPTVTVMDKNAVIPAGEYTVSYSNNVNVGEATVTVTGNGDNYTTFTATANFQIVDGSQPTLTITGKKDTVYYGDTLQLGTEGGSEAVAWSVTGGTGSTINTGRLTVKDGGTLTVKAESGSLSDTWTFVVTPKPVTAIVTAATKNYDGSATADLTVTLSGLLPGESVTDVAAEGSFTDGNAGTGKTVIITKWTIPDAVSAKYAIDCPATTTGTITPKAATVTGVTAKTGLTYSGAPQALLANEGAADGGTIAYSVDGGSTYSFNPPTATDAGSYTVWYKAVASDENHKDSAPAKTDTVTIAPITDTPSVTCTPDVFQYDGTEKTPKVVVTASGHIIPEDEYTATLPSLRIAAGQYTVTVTDKPGGNYEFTSPVTAENAFEITASSQNPLSIITDRATAYYGESFRLSAMGGSGSGQVTWSSSNDTIAKVDANGVVTVIGVGTFTVEAYREASGSYDKSNTASVPLEAKPKPVTPVVTAEDKSYDGKTDAVLSAHWESGDMVKADTIALNVTGVFATPDVGTGKKVNIMSATPSGVSGNYLITWPDSVTASIYKVSAKLATKPGNASALTYTGSEQSLFTTGGTTVGDIGTVEYSTSEKGEYSTTIPTAQNAGTYEVWYKVADSENYTGIAPAFVEVEIQKATPTISTNPTASGSVGQKLSNITLSGGATDVPGTFAWKNGDTIVESGKTYPVVFTPNDADNYNSVEFQISATSTVSNDLPIMNLPSAPSADNAASAPAQIPAQDNAASATVSAGEVEQLVQEALENQSDNIVVKPDMSGDATRAEVSLPAETLNRIVSETDASLTVSTPIADATIPQEALETLGRAGDVSVVTEQVDQTVVLRLTAGGEDVESVPGGVTLSVPVENAGPGTVAVLVREDGTRETISKSTVADGKVIIPLDGSATVEIVDNSKAFEDVPEDSWAADAVAFASAREMFSGTSETTFSPDESMSRGMLATVLYNLEGRPEQEVIMQDLEDGYSDVDGGAWYAEGVAWATENGIVNGYGNGAFGPDDSVTREQLAVMLWKYAGSPEASDKALDFTDADQANSYAQEALRWAVESGILNGYADGRLAPGGTATRAEAAQMLKNFMERA